ncbi:CBY1-interacting BAR domain-containing protein 2-like [Myxocyprinus asiaticus]|uniref:CBY1-interacting BAR domain-containing protein 2-like n=1 Tax=Myxocyprinus asiaticus TaxID=70543 RepID=UPI002221B274|nr:CBY1-interacting BAR domain-containing protein 2-like [Myxocyprinus asiaticus]
MSRDAQMKVMEATISNAEKYLGQFCMLLASYTRKTAKLRDKADMLARQLHDYASTEDPELCICIKNFSEDLAMVQDYRQAEVERLETRVVTPLKAYGDIVKTKHADLKRFNADRNKELKELQRLDRIKQKNPADRQSISQAEVNVQKATNNADRSTRQMEETIIDFQRQKLEDLKKIFMDFIMVEMLFHAKALEVYTHTFQNMQTMDIDRDLETFRNRIQVTDSYLSSQPLQTLTTSRHPSPPSSPLRSTTDLPKPLARRTLPRQIETKDEEEEEEDEGTCVSEEEEEPHTFRQSYAAEYIKTRRQK